MVWLIGTALICFESLVVLLTIQTIVRFRRIWLRWISWTCLFSLSTGVLWLAFNHTISLFSHFDYWQTRADFFSRHSPYPTLRIYLVVACTTPPIAWLIAAAVTLLRRTKNGTRLLVWNVTFRNTAWALLGTATALLLMLVANDRLLAHRLALRKNYGSVLALAVAPPRCADDENAALIYEKIELIDAENKTKLPEFEDDIEKLRGEAWATYLTANADAAGQICAGATRTHCRFDLNYSDASIVTEHPEISQLYGFNRLLYAQARRALLDRDPKLAIRNAVGLRNLARQLAADPRSDAFSCSCNARVSAARIIEHLVYVAHPADSEIQRLTSDSSDLGDRLPRMFRWSEASYASGVAECYLGLTLEENTWNKPLLKLAIELNLARMRLLFAEDDLRAIPQMFTILDGVARLKYGEKSGETKRFETRIYETGPAFLGCSWAPGDMLYFKLAALADMKTRLADFGLEVAQNDLPLKIMQRGPNVAIPPAQRPTDIFDDQPLKIIVADGGVIIYSVDVYGGDDGGTEGIPASVAGRYLRDMTFCLGDAYRVRRLTKPVEE